MCKYIICLMIISDGKQGYVYLSWMSGGQCYVDGYSGSQCYVDGYSGGQCYVDGYTLLTFMFVLYHRSVELKL